MITFYAKNRKNKLTLVEHLQTFWHEEWVQYDDTKYGICDECAALASLFSIEVVRNMSFGSFYLYRCKKCIDPAAYDLWATKCAIIHAWYILRSNLDVDCALLIMQLYLRYWADK